ncbi:mitogen-activated protein kinase kinase 9-like [Panicum virgatum]|uniref:mitogen-activated protein kinase kinase 9-like n=1 Tax=Panicum virgatum TaxID=38727 RepID=UPI0019D655BA|nr:mitogen-activated protein kinase kinase 9-like [Panicum virgatum]
MACSVIPTAPHRVGFLPHQMMMRVPAAPPPTPAPEELRLSDLDSVGDLGAGGFARVSKARHRRTGAVFALKMSYDADPDVEEEAEVLRRAAGNFSLVLCRRRGGVPEPALAEAAAHCVVGLAQLHSRGVAHLDVKPDNFLASSRGEIKISDFNTSRILYGGAGERLQVPITAGTRAYFSPERFAPRARAGPHGAMAADVWGLGVTVLELFLGRFAVVPDVDKASAAELELAICHGEPLRVPEEAEASPELRGFVAACLQWEPARRATVPQLLGHPFLTRRDVEASRRALRDLIVQTL